MRACDKNGIGGGRGGSEANTLTIAFLLIHSCVHACHFAHLFGLFAIHVYFFLLVYTGTSLLCMF